MSVEVKVRRASPGLYAITAGPAFRFDLSRSEDDPRRWQLAPRSNAAWKALGEPERAPVYGTLREAVAVVRGAVESAMRERVAAEAGCC